MPLSPRELHEEVFSRIDCTRCANCCKTIRPGFTEEDIARIAAQLGMSEETFIAAHLEIDPEEGGHRTKVIPCPFLGEDDRCTIYEVRPLGCQYGRDWIEYVLMSDDQKDA